MQGIMVMGLCKGLYVKKLQNSIFKYWDTVSQIIDFQCVVRTHLFWPYDSARSVTIACIRRINRYFRQNKGQFCNLLLS